MLSITSFLKESLVDNNFPAMPSIVYRRIAIIIVELFFYSITELIWTDRKSVV